MDYNITYREKDKGWQFIISYKENGKWKQKGKQGFKSKKEAKKAADIRLEELKKSWATEVQVDKEYEGITFYEFGDMFTRHQQLYKEPNTIKGYRSAIKAFKNLHPLPLDKIQHKDIQAGVDMLVQKGLKPMVVKAYVRRLAVMMDNAVSAYLIIPANPINSKSLTLPDNKTNDKKRALTNAETERLLETMRRCKTGNAYRHYVLTLTLLTTGIRIGEAVGLTWSDIDFFKGTIMINKQWKKLKGGDRHGFGTLKSKNSERTIPMPSHTMSELKKYKECSVTDIHNRIFPYSTSHAAAGGLSRIFKKTGSDVTPHDLRHTYATNLISNGMDFKTVAKLLGHTPEMTINTYSHFTDDMLERAKITIRGIYAHHTK